MGGTCYLQFGDCTEILPKRKEIKEIADWTVDAVITDPPYGISKESFVDRSKFKSPAMRRDKPVTLDFGDWDKMERKDFIDFTRKWMYACADTLKDGGAFISFFHNADISLLAWIGEECGIRLRNIFTWRKTNPCPSVHRVNYLSACEQIFIGSKGDAQWTFNFTTQNEMHNFFETQNKSIYGVTEHPTEKPVSLISHFIKIHTEKGDTVLDPFMGSGTTGVACIETDRRFIGIEKDEHWFDVAMHRIKDRKDAGVQQDLFGEGAV